jgi:hypothetical protein
MLVLALLLAAQGASPPVAEELPRHAAEQDCWGGRILWFEHGSDQLVAESLTDLRDWSRFVREDNEDGHLEVEASADFIGSTFNRDLSVRRTTQLKHLLRENGLGHLQIEVRPVLLPPSRAPDPDPEVEAEKAQFAHVRLMVREASEFLAGGIYRECR